MELTEEEKQILEFLELTEDTPVKTYDKAEAEQWINEYEEPVD